MGGVIPLSDASRRPATFPVATMSIIAVNAAVFVLELIHGAVRPSLVGNPRRYRRRASLDHNFDIDFPPCWLDAHYRQHGVSP